MGFTTYRSAILATAENHLIELLPRKERRCLLALCERVELLPGAVLSEYGTRTRYAYFPVDGFISLSTHLDGKPAIEVGMVGREGMVGAQLVLGVSASPLHAVVQGSGAAWRVGRTAFCRELAQSAALQRGLHRYVYVLMSQLAESAGCPRFHQIGPRLARWLLMSQDRAHRDSFHVTQEYVANMLGVRRVGVSVAAGELQRRGLIRYIRGELTVVDRPGLEAAACSCYAADLQAYAELLG
jgi:CRP-like cAMP-binding protein